MQATIITIGDEILIGQVIDTNSAWMGRKLNELGVNIKEILSIKDEYHSIVSALRRVVESSDLVLITGGLGPTKDDITKKCIADYLGVEMEFSQSTYDRIIELFKNFGREVSDSHKQQSFLPAGAELLHNAMGTAPGMLFRKNNTKIVSMPGVPYEMKYIIEKGVLPMVESEILEEDKVYNRTIMTAGLGETQVEDALIPIIDTFPNSMSVAYLPSLGSVRIRVTGKRADSNIIDNKVELFAERLGDNVFGFDDQSLAESLKILCIHKGIKVGLAESCTGGILSHKITEVSGCSGYYIGTIVSYTNELKQKLLGVKAKTLSEHGAVSEATVIEMANGALQVLNTDVAVSVSGIAGPTGGSELKPVGTIWICIANRSEHFAFRIKSSKNRKKNIEYAATVALNNLRMFVVKRM